MHEGLEYDDPCDICWVISYFLIGGTSTRFFFWLVKQLQSVGLVYVPGQKMIQPETVV